MPKDRPGFLNLFMRNGEPRWGGVIGGLIAILPAIKVMNSVSTSVADGGWFEGIGLTIISGILMVGLGAFGGNQAQKWLKPDETMPQPESYVNLGQQKQRQNGMDNAPIEIVSRPNVPTLKPEERQIG